MLWGGGGLKRNGMRRSIFREARLEILTRFLKRNYGGPKAGLWALFSYFISIADLELVNVSE